MVFFGCGCGSGAAGTTGVSSSGVILDVTTNAMPRVATVVSSMISDVDRVIDM